MNPTSKERLKGMSFNKMIPNILTLLAMSAGMTAIRFALQDRWELSVIAIVVASILDGLDGRIARILKGTSKFGAELDSLSDFICFGVAPAMMLYLWSMQEAGRFGWILVVLYSICCALRLARFNTNMEQPDLPVWAYNFFSGVPAPMAAGLVLLPMILSFQFGRDILIRPEVTTLFLIAVSILMVSRIPTYSFKNFRVPLPWVLPTLLFVGIFAAFLVAEPWPTISVVMILYAASFPLSIRSFRSLKKQAEALQRKSPPAKAEDLDDGE
ncbi:MAG: CDP-diacylglycerol--serine O-phosphatidyltransferase [Rhodospirillales bacterium]|nr:CDP-diacylglycerol--serine O-phosphatidyltransferase [Rhodospirillales bacterium]